MKQSYDSFLLGETPDASRREFLGLLVAGAAFASGESRSSFAGVPSTAPTAPATDVHQHLLDLAVKLEDKRRARFAAVRTPADLLALRQNLRDAFLHCIGGLPGVPGDGVPPVRKMGMIEAEDYTIEKLALESLPGYFVPALLYVPKAPGAAEPTGGRAPAVLSPCGHSEVGKAYDDYQILHINLARRGYVVLTYDPVGQGERSQFWDDARGKSRFNLVCGEHAVLGNPLYLLGENLARYRIWDGMRALDYLCSLDFVDPKRVGCAGNSGGGTLTAYLSALDERIGASAPTCYLTTLPKRMANRAADPDGDPEQDLFGFVSEGIDHAGLLAMISPRPALLGAAKKDFFPIEGTRQTFEEGRRLYEVAGEADKVRLVEADEKHGLTLPLRQAIYDWFDRWLAGRPAGASRPEFPLQPRPAKDLLVCPGGQANLASPGGLRSRPLLPLTWEQFNRRPDQPYRPDAQRPPRRPLRDLLALDPEFADPFVEEVHPLTRADQVLIAFVNGSESPDWRQERELMRAMADAGHAVLTIDPRGVGRRRPELPSKGIEYTDPLTGSEADIAYDAFLVGASLLGMRVTDVLSALRQVSAKVKPKRVALCGRRDAAWIACLAAAAGEGINRVAVEELPPPFATLFTGPGRAVNAAGILPGLLREFGDVPELLKAIAPRRVLVAGGAAEEVRKLDNVRVVEGRLAAEPDLLKRWVVEEASR